MKIKALKEILTNFDAAKTQEEREKILNGLSLRVLRKFVKAKALMPFEHFWLKSDMIEMILLELAA